ncbi:fibronectin type III domain-containing protein, partial [archaeon]|nr:fibronectin type III domain-containing protein [archaeon]
MSNKINAKLCRIALFMIWLIVLMPVYTANALVITFDPGTDMVVTDNLAIINFTTDEAVAAKVFYGLEEATEYIDSKPAKTEHSVEISGIASSTTFKFYIEAKSETDTVRSPAEGGDFYGFTTEELRDRTPPRAVTGVAAPAITKTSITLEWKADPRDTDVDHFKVYKGGTLLADSVMELTFTDSGLNSSVEYIYMVSAVDAAGNEGPRTTQKATTRSAAFQPLAITEFKATVFGTSIYATWYTSMPSHTRLRYGQTPLLLDQKKESPEMITAHNISLTGLPPNSNITILAESCDAASNCGNASPVTLRTTQKIDLNLQVDGMDCDANTPKFANSNRLDVNGRASLGAEVIAYVNGNKLRYKSITDTGTFSFSGLELDPDKAENELRVTASDHISADKVCVEKILLDYYAPQVDFTNDTLNISVVTEQSVIIKGNLTDEHKVTMYAYLQSLDDSVPPPAPQDVTNGTVGPNSITITWSKYGDDVKDAYKYLVYRTDVADGPIAELEPTATEYTDSNVSTTATYTYQVSAFDRAGNEGP